VSGLDLPSNLRICVSRSVLGAVAIALLSLPVAAVTTYPEGFAEEVAFSGLTNPTNVRFAPDGRVFIAEKAGVIKVFDSLTDSTPDVLVDLGLQVHGWWDRGLHGLAVDSAFPAQPYVYVLYTFNFDPNEDPACPVYDPGNPDCLMPRWPDSCPDPPGATDADGGCVVNGRLSRLEVAPDNSLVGAEVVLIENRWCEQYPSHSIGDLRFDPIDRVLYASAGDGASFNFVDYGQGGGNGVPLNPCDDPPGGLGNPMSPPSAEGGALRTQDIRTPGDPVSYDGTIIAIDPDTGDAWPANPLIGGDPDDDRIIAIGQRNPFRMAVRPGTHEVWTGDVGWNTWEEVNRVTDAQDGFVENFGWPCWEGVPKQSGYDGANLTICEDLYDDDAIDASTHTEPHFSYDHSVAIPGCSRTGSSAIAGLAFYTGGAYPASYDDALFFADYSRRCIHVMFADGSGLPDPSTAVTFGEDVSEPVSLEMGPDGNVYYSDHNAASPGAGRIMRIVFQNTPPTAVATAAPTNGPLDLQVFFDGSQSFDPDPGGALDFEWDLDGDGQFDDSTLESPTYTYTVEGEYLVSLRVTDDQGVDDVDQLVIIAGNSEPTALILTPTSGMTWQAGDEIFYQGEGTDPDDGPLPGGSLSWDVVLHECPCGQSCASQTVQQFTGDQGSFFAPDQAEAGCLELVLTATDSGLPGGGGVLSDEDRVGLDADTVDLTFDTDPSGLQITVGSRTEPTPILHTVVVGSTVPVNAISPQNFQGWEYAFDTWSDGGARAHDIVAPVSPTIFTATYELVGPATDWWNAAWLSRMKITFDNTGQTGNLLVFPVLVTLDDERIDYALTDDLGADIRFVDSDATTVLPHEIELWNETGTSWIWVGVPQIDAGSDTDSIWLYFNNDSAIDAQDAAGVWSSGYVGVWHLHDDFDDSSPAPANDGTNFGSTDVAGKIGDGQSFDGSSNYINVGNDTSLAVTGQLSVEAWARISDPDAPGAWRVMSKKQNWDSPDGYNLEYKPVENDLTLLTSGGDYGRASGVDLDTSWHYLAGTASSGTCRVYVDGVDATTDGVCDLLAAGSMDLNIGRRAGGGDYWNGDLDEIRVSDVARSTDWIAAQHLSMTDAFATYGSVETSCLDDTDGDGTPDCLDNCPNDPNKDDPGICGCGASEIDTDADTVPDCIDQCAGQDDTIDLDGNAIPDCVEICPGGCDITGTVFYYRDSSADAEPSVKTVPNVDIDQAQGLVGDGMADATTNTDGVYGLWGETGTVTVAAMDKYGAGQASDHNGAISALDASLTARPIFRQISRSLPT
jgi:glucose/arabinose dehydrogenase